MTIAKEEISRKSYTLEELADFLGASLKGDPRVRIRGVNALEEARSDELSFLSHDRYIPRLSSSEAAALVVSSDFEHLDRHLLIVDQPYFAFARVAQLFSEPPPLAPGVHPSACVEESVWLESGVSVGPLVCIGAGSEIGRGSRIYGGTYLGRDVQIGQDCLIYPNVTILDGSRIGNRVIIHSGTVIGSDGFGFAQDESGHHLKIPQVGIVQIDDDVEIGANCTIDRATFGKTRIQEGVKFDNMVHIAHNVTVGKHSILVAQVGIAGSTQLGRHVMLGGQVGVVGHIRIGDRVRVGAKSGVGRSVKDGEDLSGIPAVPHKEWLRTYATLRRLPQLKDELRQLKEKVRKLENLFEESKE